MFYDRPKDFSTPPHLKKEMRIAPTLFRNKSQCIKAPSSLVTYTSSSSSSKTSIVFLLGVDLLSIHSSCVNARVWGHSNLLWPLPQHLKQVMSWTILLGVLGSSFPPWSCPNDNRSSRCVLEALRLDFVKRTWLLISLLLIVYHHPISFLIKEIMIQSKRKSWFIRTMNLPIFMSTGSMISLSNVSFSKSQAYLPTLLLFCFKELHSRHTFPS